VINNNYILVAFFLLVLNFVGCSLVGLAVGINSDSDENLYSLEKQHLANIDTSDFINVITKNNKSITGKFEGFSRLSFQDYSKRYEETRSRLRDTIYLPKLGESIFFEKLIIESKGNRKIKTILKNKTKKFFGFSLGGVLLSDSTYEKSVTIPNNLANNAEGDYGMKIDFEEFKTLLMNKKLPLATCIILRTPEGEIDFLGDDIKEIHSNNTKYGWLIGTLVGIVIDVSILSSMEFEISFGGKKSSETGSRWFNK